MTETSWPRSISASARSLMCCWTPPGTSHEYGHAMPILTARRLREALGGRGGLEGREAPGTRKNRETPGALKGPETQKNQKTREALKGPERRTVRGVREVGG